MEKQFSLSEQATNAVSEVQKKQLQEVKAFASPPILVKDTLCWSQALKAPDDATCAAFLKEDGSWRLCQKEMANVQGLLNQLLEFGQKFSDQALD